MPRPRPSHARTGRSRTTRLDHDRGDTRPRQQRGDCAHHKRDRKTSLRSIGADCARESRKVDLEHVEHRERERDKDGGNSQIENGDALIVPNDPAVRMTTSPRTPAAPWRHRMRRRGGSHARVNHSCPAPMIARLIGIIGRTQGVRLSARPPSSTRVNRQGLDLQRVPAL